MFKRFIEWVFAKIIIDKRIRHLQLKQGEVHWCALGENIGDEENGKGEIFRRPVLIFKKFNNNIFWGIPLSTQNKDNRYYVKINVKGSIRSAMISQLRILDTKRLDEYVGYISKIDFVKIQIQIINIIWK